MDGTGVSGPGIAGGSTAVGGGMEPGWSTGAGGGWAGSTGVSGGSGGGGGAIPWDDDYWALRARLEVPSIGFGSLRAPGQG